MKEDILFIQPKHESTAQTIFDKVINERQPKYIVAISGESESGKSEISYCLGRLLRKTGIRTKILNMDSFYHVPPMERRAWRQKNGVKSIGYKEYDWDKIDDVLLAFKEGRTSVMPYTDIISLQVDMLKTEFDEIDMLIVNGLYSIKIKDAQLKVFIEVSFEDTKDVQVRKDMETLDDWRMKELKREHEVIESIKGEANYFVDLDTSMKMYHL